MLQISITLIAFQLRYRCNTGPLEYLVPSLSLNPLMVIPKKKFCCAEQKGERGGSAD